MSSPLSPTRTLSLIAVVCCTFTGCAWNQDSTPGIGDSGPKGTTRETFLAATTPPAPQPSPTVETGPGSIEPGTPPDAQAINAILDEMLAGHEALKTRKTLADEAPSASPEATESTPASVELAVVEVPETTDLPTAGLTPPLTGSLAIDQQDLSEALPRVEPTTNMIRALLASAARSDAPLKQHLALAMLMAWVSPEKPFEPTGLAELTEQERTVVSIVYEHFKSLGTNLDDGGGEADLVTALTGIIDAVEGQSPFEISRMELCSWVRDFGDIDVIEPLTFSPKERPRFIWYVELEGVSPTENAATGEWSHEFDVKVEVLTKDTGIPVISPVEDRVRYASTSRLRDLFLRNILEIPEDLQFDWYTTKVTITEVASGIRSQKSLDLLWVPNLAAGEAHFLRQAAVEE